ncbi:MAG: MYG1 family protein [Candidatus Paceibacterota bacterium]|jgi:uncharacterized UPF0160 family protein
MIKNEKLKLSKKLVTHNGSFHADDIFSAAIFLILLEKKGETFDIIRTRDEKIIETGDYIFDIGGMYNPEENKFDHHQVGGAGKRSSGIEYAACGLVWKKFGIDLCGSQKVADLVDGILIAPIDAGDNGFDLVENKYETSPYFIQHAFNAMRPTWKEVDLNEDEMFLKCVVMAKEILMREIIQAQDALLAEEMVFSIYEKTEDKKIIVLDENYPFEYTLNNFPEPLYVIYPRKSDGFWGIRAVRKDPKTFLNRKNFPKLWAGLRDEELQNVTGVRDAIFCHRGLFLAVAKSKEGAIKLAQIAVESL